MTADTQQSLREEVDFAAATATAAAARDEVAAICADPRVCGWCFAQLRETHLE